jgi:isoleucyl-tRNA synthetase
MFPEVPEANFPQLEQHVLNFWREREIFKKSTQKDAPAGDYIFYEGPPTANGKPGVHHVISRAFKDLFPRFKTMQGYRVGRKGGWDTHGLPVEIAIEKRLGFTRKSQIDDYGIEKFNALAKEWVFENIQDWNDMTERIGFWVDLEDAYVTYHNSYIESCWWVFKALWERGLLGEDYKTTWHCPRNNTSLASHEVSLGYKENVPDPSVYPKFPAEMDTLVEAGIVTETSPQVYLMAWTTTPWTLAANVALAVSDEAEYGLFEAPRTARDEDATDLYIMVTALADDAFGEGKHKLLKTFSGQALVDVRYQPILRARVPEGEDLSKGYRVIADSSVTTGEGTGVLHVAPAYGDLEIGRQFDLPTIFSVDLLGEVYPEVRPLDVPEDGDGPYAKQFFKDADKPIAKDLLARGLMYRQATIKHTYPFNWRDGTPLINYAKKSWYIRTSKLKDKLVSNNQNIKWVPEHIRDGRFGNWLENNIDWAVSRERYWGCPLPIWEAEDGSTHCVGSLAELAELSGRELEGLELHRPYVDDITFEKDGKTFTRVPYTVDVWFESGAMPYAQWHYLGENSTPEAAAALEQNFPADYICEAIDQTRGWFYSLHALGTLLTHSGSEGVPAGPLAHLAPDQSSFKNVICLGHILDEKGEKMSKSKGNIVEPNTVLNNQGADALRWYMYSSAPPGNSRRFSENLVNETLRDFFMTLWNTYSFFVLYANLDKPDLTQDVPAHDRPEIDRWLIAKTHKLTSDVTAFLEDYDPTSASRSIRDFVVDELSNWYVRRNRRRFWKGDSDSDKLAAYKTLYETLVTVAKLMAPLAPFMSEHLYQNLVMPVDASAPESVHLAAWPKADASLIDETLLRDMNALIRVVELGRSARAASKVKVRQPLPEVLVRVRNQDELNGLKRLETQILEELNVKAVTYLDVTAGFVDYTVRPNLPLIGKRLGKRVPAFRKYLSTIDGKDLAKNVREGVMTTVELDGEMYEFEPEAFLLDAQSPEGYAAVEERGYLAALNTQLTPELLQEGLVRDVIRLVQDARKNAGLDVSDRVQLSLQSEGELASALETHKDIVMREVLAVEVRFDMLASAAHTENVEIDGTALTISLAKADVVSS